MSDTYEFMTRMLISGAFGMMVAFWIWGIGYWIVSIVRWVKKKLHKKRHPETEPENTSQE